MIDTAGFHFVVSTPAQSSQTHDKRARKAIQSHATKAGRRQAIRLRSWISPNREVGSLKQSVFEETPSPRPTLSVSSPRTVGAYLSGLQLPPGVEPYMIQDIVKLVQFDMYGIYPFEICLDVHPVVRGWFPYMLSDECCLQSMMFSVRAFTDGALPNQLSRFARLHLAKTLQMLQARLNDSDLTFAISDGTIMGVFFLASAAELMGDFAAVENHVRGLEKIVNLRGGVRALNIHNNLQVKVCRADLSYALLSGHQPLFFKTSISWDCFLADRGLIQCSHHPHDVNVHIFLKNNIDGRLHDVFRDLHAFSCISNLAYQTTRKLLPEIYNEVMISILYRLTHLSFDGDPIQEVFRISLLAVSSTLFMQRQFMDNPYAHLSNLYRNALFQLSNSMGVELPVSISLWMTMLLHVVEHREQSPANWLGVWFDRVISHADVKSWPEAREMLRSMVWVDFVHDRVGKFAFEASMIRLGYLAGRDH